MSSCWPGIERGNGIQALTVSPAGTASAWTVSAWVMRRRRGSTLSRCVARAASITARWWGLIVSIGLPTKRLRIDAPRAGLGAEPEQVGGGAVEVQPLAVDVHALQQALSIPARKFRIGEIGDLPAQAFAHLRRILVEVERDAAHAFALEGEHAGIKRGGIGQCAFDLGAGAGEVAPVDAGDHRGHDRAGGLFRTHCHRILVRCGNRQGIERDCASACGHAETQQQSRRQRAPTRLARRRHDDGKLAWNVAHQKRSPTIPEVTLV